MTRSTGAGRAGSNRSVPAVSQSYPRMLALGAALIPAFTAQALSADSTEPSPVRLVLQITVDGLRGDLLNRYGDGFGEGGFRYLLNNGTVFTDAHYRHANTETIVGHSTLATGASPAVHGMVGNAWFDREAGKLAYNIEDPAYPLLPVRTGKESGEQVDPAQQASRSNGRSPRSLLAPTLADTLAAFHGGRSKIFAVSGKDRGAVPMAGQVGKSFWFSTDTGDFVTSRYYYDEYPGWAEAWNRERRANAYGGKAWELTGEAADYVNGQRDDRPYEADLRGYGRTFPHPFGEAGDKLFYTRLMVSPVGDRLTLDFAKSLVEGERLGVDDVPDFLSISYSSVDAVNHFFGPSSLEQEAVLRQLDRSLADLLAFVDQKVGLGHTLIVLSADHGMADMPEYVSGLGFAAGRIDAEDVVAAADQAGWEQFDIDGIVQGFYRPNLYLDQEKIAEEGLDPERVQRQVAAALARLEGIALAVPAGDLTGPQRTPELAGIRLGFHEGRSGEIYVLQDPYWFLYAKGPIVAMHGTPYRYDTHVPVIFAGGRIPAREVHRRVHPMDVAPTIAALLGISPPGTAQGRVLTEVLDTGRAQEAEPE